MRPKHEGILGCTFHDPNEPCTNPRCIALGECWLEVRFRELTGQDPTEVTRAREADDHKAKARSA